LRFEIPPRDISAKNFDSHTIKVFFEGFDGEDDTWDSPGLDCESLVRLCHAFWWLKCNTRALRSSAAVQLLKPKIQTNSWKATGSRCANRLVVSLALGWKDQLTTSCNELVHETVENNDNLLAGLPSAVAERKRVQEKIRGQIVLKICDSPGSGKYYDTLSAKPNMRYLRNSQEAFNISPKEMVQRLLDFIDPSKVGSPPRSLTAAPADGWGRKKPAAGVLVHSMFEAGSRLWKQSREKSSHGVLKLTGELETLKAEMSTDNDYRDACIKYWKEKGGYWTEDIHTE